MITVSPKKSIYLVPKEDGVLSGFDLSENSSSIVHCHGKAAEFLRSLDKATRVKKLDPMILALWSLKMVEITPPPEIPDPRSLALSGNGWSLAVESMDSNLQAFAIYEPCDPMTMICPPGLYCDPMTANWCDPWWCIS